MQFLTDVEYSMLYVPVWKLRKKISLLLSSYFCPTRNSNSHTLRDQRINIEYQRTNAQQLWRGNGWKFFLTKTKIVNRHKERLYLRLVTMLPTVPTQTVQYSAVYWPDPRAADLCTIQSQTISRVTIHQSRVHMCALCNYQPAYLLGQLYVYLFI